MWFGFPTRANCEGVSCLQGETIISHPLNLTVLVTVAALLMYFMLIIRVSIARVKAKISAPAMTGDPEMERALRVQENTLEWLPIFVPALWMFAIYWNDRLAALLGVVWILGRIVYAFAYWAGKNRSPAFGVQMLATFILLFGAAAGAIRTMMVTGI